MLEDRLKRFFKAEYFSWREKLNNDPNAREFFADLDELYDEFRKEFQQYRQEYRGSKEYFKEKYQQWEQKQYQKQSGRHSSKTHRNDPHFNRKEARYYANLEIPYGSDFATIRKAYRTLQKQYHPDRFNHDDEKKAAAEKISSKLNEAYTYFAEKEKRKGQ